MKTLLLTAVLGLYFGIVFSQEVQDTSIRVDHYGKVVERVPLTAESRNGILVFESPDQLYRLWFDIRVETDGQIFLGKPLNPIGNGVTIRRARFAVKTNLGKNWYGELDLNVSNGALQLEDAYFSYDFLNGFKVRVGNYKEGFSMSETTSSRYLKFMERANVVSTFAPSRHLGLETSYNGKLFLVSGAVFFQEIKDLETLTYVEDNNKDFGRDQGLSLTGKFVFQPFGANQDYGVHLAYGYSYRQPKTDVKPSEYTSIRYSTRSLSKINRKKYLDTDLISDYKNQLISNIELAGFYKGLNFQVEVLNNQTKRENNQQTLKFGGYYAQAAYLLFGGKQVYDKSAGEFTQPVKGKKWGDVELALRYDYVDLNDKVIYGGSAGCITAGINFYTSRNVKFMLNYSNINHDRYASGKNKLFVGSDVNGLLTKDPTKVANGNGKAGDDYNQLGIRCEINF
ncbi:OprO/OprP family phosphate-selective porin [Pedobacter arcticus]|uniref:OprO/OprP family phosphate-selective porin n=1 Tax=Pedobacter arcticus TaxID=752140 RepID=UPI000375C454|nr:porin [Pedobacter arcticus]